MANHRNAIFVCKKPNQNSNWVVDLCVNVDTSDRVTLYVTHYMCTYTYVYVYIEMFDYRHLVYYELSCYNPLNIMLTNPVYNLMM